MGSSGGGAPASGHAHIHHGNSAGGGVEGGCREGGAQEAPTPNPDVMVRGVAMGVWPAFKTGRTSRVNGREVKMCHVSIFERRPETERVNAVRGRIYEPLPGHGGLGAVALREAFLLKKEIFL